MRSAFIDKLIKRMDRLEPGEIQGIVLELVREKKFQEKVFEALQEGVILLDTEGKVSYVNRAACTFFGMEQDQVLGQRLAQGVRGLDWNEMLKPGTVVSRDLEVFYPENRYLNFYITSIDDDTPLGFVMLIRDVTETRKRTEVRFLQPEIEAAKVKLKLELRSDLPAMPLDPGQMKQAVYNLIRNACQAMPKGGTLTINGTFTDFEVRLSFEDTGKGINAEQMGKLFQPFSTTRTSGMRMLSTRSGMSSKVYLPREQL